MLGGTRFVGRALVEDAVTRGWSVTALHRGRGPLPEGVERLRADRTDPAAMSAALSGRSFDLAVDTWALPPTPLDAVRADRFGYVSSQSVYRWGHHVDESSPLVEPEGEDYAAVKRRGELASLTAFPDALLARAGLILGPYEDIGRLPWWLDRISRGGPVVAPGRPERPLQLVDARDLAAWLLTELAAGRSGAVDVTSPSGHTTTKGLLEACGTATGGDAELVWISEQELSDAGVEPWTQLPCWVPEQGEYAGFLEGDASLAARTGLVCRPIEHTVADTWAWVQREGMPPQRRDRAVHGLPEDVERSLLSRR